MTYFGGPGVIMPVCPRPSHGIRASSPAPAAGFTRNGADLPRCITGDTLRGMADVSVRDLRNKGGRVLKRVAGGETITVTLDGEPVAELRPVPRRALSAAMLIERWRNLPPVDPTALRADIDRVFDTSL